MVLLAYLMKIIMITQNKFFNNKNKNILIIIHNIFLFWLKLIIVWYAFCCNFHYYFSHLIIQYSLYTYLFIYTKISYKLIFSEKKLEK